MPRVGLKPEARAGRAQGRDEAAGRAGLARRLLEGRAAWPAQGHRGLSWGDGDAVSQRGRWPHACALPPEPTNCTLHACLPLQLGGKRAWDPRSLALNVRSLEVLAVLTPPGSEAETDSPRRRPRPSLTVTGRGLRSVHGPPRPKGSENARARGAAETRWSEALGVAGEWLLLVLLYTASFVF